MAAVAGTCWVIDVELVYATLVAVPSEAVTVRLDPEAVLITPLTGRPNPLRPIRLAAPAPDDADLDGAAELAEPAEVDEPQPARPRRMTDPITRLGVR